MKKVATIAALLALVPAAYAAVGDVAGAWQIEGTIGQMPVSVTCTLEEADSKLTGVCRNDEVGDLPLTGETDGSTASWTYSVNYQGQQFMVTYNGALQSANEMQGSISVGGNPSGSFTGRKQ